MKNLLTFERFIVESQENEILEKWTSPFKNDSKLLLKININDLNSILSKYSEVSGPIGTFSGGESHTKDYVVFISMMSISNPNDVTKLQSEITDSLKKLGIEGPQFTVIKSPQSTPQWSEAIKYKKDHKLKGKLVYFSVSVFNEKYKW